MKINAKILVSVLSTLLVVFTAVVGYISFNFRTMALSNANEMARYLASKSALEVKAELEVDLDVARTMSYVFEGFKKIPAESRDSIYVDIMKNLLSKNPLFTSVWVSWELSAIDPEWSNDYGRVRFETFRAQYGLSVSYDSLNLSGDIETSTYYKVKIANEEALTDPYMYSYKGESKKQIMASVAVPINNSGKYVGLAGLDIKLDRFQKLIDRIKPYPDSYAFLVANNANYIAHPDISLLNRSSAETILDFEDKQDYERNIRNGISFTQKLKTEDDEYLITYSPFSVGTTKTPWTVGVAIPLSVIAKKGKKNFLFTIIVGVVGFLIITVIILIISSQITTPISRATDILKELAMGKVSSSEKIKTKGKDEIAEMGRSVATLTDTIRRTAAFAEQIGKQNLEASYKAIGKHDVLGNSLLQMQSSLVDAKKERTIRIKEDEKNNWVTNGYAEFADLLRLYSGDFDKLTYNIIVALVRKLDAVIGALYIVNDDNLKDVYIQPVATYGFDKKHMKQSRVEIGEGFVGRCIKERETVHEDRLPKDYVEVESFSGSKTPNVLLLVPLILGDEVWGAFELASFKGFKEYELHFAERISENIASAISSIRNSIKTSRLLEESNMQAEELDVKELQVLENFKEMEIMRAEVTKSERELEQTRRELMKREQEMANKTEIIRKREHEIDSDLRDLLSLKQTIDTQNKEMDTLTAAIDQALMRSTYTEDGTILEVNDKYCEITGYVRDELVGRSISKFIPEHDKQWSKVWNDVKMGIPFKGKMERKMRNEEIETFLITYTPVLNEKGHIEKIYYLGYPLA